MLLTVWRFPATSLSMYNNPHWGMLARPFIHPKKIKKKLSLIKTSVTFSSMYYLLACVMDNKIWKNSRINFFERVVFNINIILL